MARQYGGRSQVKVVPSLSEPKWDGCCPARLITFPVEKHTVFFDSCIENRFERNRRYPADGSAATMGLGFCWHPRSRYSP